MLEKYSYIKSDCSDGDIADRVEKLFSDNNQNKRYLHICAVVNRIDRIALRYGLDREKCSISALLHDISTLMKWEDMLPYAMENEWELCDAEMSHPFLLHQRISEVITREDFGISDKDILQAIAFHTSLCANATPYQMALFIADKLDWSIGGHPPYYEAMMAALDISLEAACLEYIKYQEQDGNLPVLHSDWERAVEWIKSL